EWSAALPPLLSTCPPPTDLSSLSLHDALPICACIRGAIAEAGVDAADIAAVSTTCMREGIVLYDEAGREIWACANVDARSDDEVDRKSTRLNSSHVSISYAVFCLKKKTDNTPH